MTKNGNTLTHLPANKVRSEVFNSLSQDSSSPNLIATSSNKGTTIILDNRMFPTLEGKTNVVKCHDKINFIYEAQDSFMQSDDFNDFNSDAIVQTFDKGTGTIQGGINSVQMSSNQNKLVTAGNDKYIRVYDIKNNSLYNQLFLKSNLTKVLAGSEVDFPMRKTEVSIRRAKALGLTIAKAPEKRSAPESAPKLSSYLPSKMNKM